MSCGTYGEVVIPHGLSWSGGDGERVSGGSGSTVSAATASLGRCRLQAAMTNSATVYPLPVMDWAVDLPECCPEGFALELSIGLWAMLDS
jgi:hypothetical protein